MPPAVLAAMVIGSAAISATGSIMQGVNAKKSGDIAAQQDERNAHVAMQQSGAEIAANDYTASRTLATSSANAAAAGVAPSGSPTVVNQESIDQAILKDAYSRYSGKLQASQDMYAAANSRWEGNVALESGIMDATGTLLTAGTAAAKTGAFAKLGGPSAPTGGGARP